MGLFSFLKKAGSGSLKEKEAAAKAAGAEASREYKSKLMADIVKSLGIEVENLKVDLNNDTVTVSGTTQSQADKEKIILSLGNVDGVSGVDDQLEVIKSDPPAVFYEVKSGDTLSKIAKAHYGNAQKYMEIFEANTPMLKDPNKIYPGQVLRIPALE